MDIRQARVIAADITINGVGTEYRLWQAREAYDAFFFEGLMHTDNRPEHGAQLILQTFIDTMTTSTSEMEN